jgi:hypothetical protein
MASKENKHKYADKGRRDVHSDVEEAMGIRRR